MKFQETPIKGLYVIEPEPHLDSRGYFSRFFCKKEFEEAGLDSNIVQINRSLTRGKGTVRGLHRQKEPMAEVKIVQCLEGAVVDVVIDMRENSPTYRQWFSAELSKENKKIFYVPKGFAHGIQTLSDECVLEYYVTQFYSPEHEVGIRWNDPAFGIKWPLEVTDISEKDKSWPLL